ncbi:SBBP repeat-containing protein [Gimibacter soli]|uniref:SBBP repeat-containing protein n=1 Tax=Gimibacter soli TaxID=3024400 RepID=A0AAF0BMF3_9PROT|nr:SBBP repeat-containing protein [Gimibacter soli]WCL54436.1 SBBP repeat-containing protein [Gimibacter soli]
MAFFGNISGSGGLFGGNAQSFRPTIVGISTSLLSAVNDAKLTQIALNSLSSEDRAKLNQRVPTNTLTTPPWENAETPRSLEQQVREVRGLNSFINLKDSDIKGLANDPDQQATFVLYKALNNLRVLAEYASQKSTTSSTIAQLDALFKSGLTEVRDYLSSTSLNNLDLFLGDKQYKTETTTRLGKNASEYDGKPVAETATDAVVGLTGNEVFTVTLSKNSVAGNQLDSDTFTVDLSEISGTLSLKAVTDLINSKIEALQGEDELGNPLVDGEGNPVSKYTTRFVAAQDSRTGDYAIRVKGTILEDAKFEAAVNEPTLYVSSAVSQLDDAFAITSRVTELNNLTGTISVDDTFSFSGVDLGGTEFKGLVSDEEDEDIDPRIKAMRDKMLAESRADVIGEDAAAEEAEAEDEDATSITNVDAKNRVSADTSASKIATDSEGNVYVIGTTTGSFGHQINAADTQDVFLTKFDSTGNVVFSRLLGAADSASGYAITIDGEDNVIIAGQTNSALSTKDVISGTDAFVTKLSKRGDEIFRYQLDTAGETSGLSLAVDAAGDIILGGYTKSGISATSGFSGGKDGLLLKLDGDTGTKLASAVYGTSSNESVKGVAVSADGNILIAAEEGGNAVVRKLSATDFSVIDTVDFGYLGTGGSVEGLRVDGNDVYLVGTTTSALTAGGSATQNGSLAGGYDGFVAKVTDGGGSLSADYTTYIGTSGTDRLADVAVSGGKVYVAGSTAGTIAGENKTGSYDGFVTRIDAATGAVEDTQQFGEQLARSTVGGVAFTTKGNSVLETLGLPQGTILEDQKRDLQTQTSARAGDYFYISVDGGTKKKITLSEGDDFNDIARKIRIAAFSKLTVSVSTSSEGAKLKLEAKNATIDLIAGKGDQDLLERIGLTPGKLLPKNEALGIDQDEVEPDPANPFNLGGAYALKLDGALNIGDKKAAKYVLGLMDSAISTVQRAFRSLEYDPIKAQLLEDSKKNANIGQAPAYLTAKIANYQDALNRLQSSTIASPTSFFF